MAWHSQMGSGMGNVGNNATDTASSQPQGTEYTLQGVMRFLQTEWHRHERDRNAWEIERQEMSARIAKLEGEARRSDVTQTTLKKYISMLQKTLEQIRHTKKDAAPKQASSGTKMVDGKFVKALVKDKNTDSAADIDDIQIPELLDAVPDKSNLMTYLQQSTGEFAYLMVVPTNPGPPPDTGPESSFDEDQEQMEHAQRALEHVYLPERELFRVDQSYAPQESPEPKRTEVSAFQVQNAVHGGIPLRTNESQATVMMRSSPERPPPATQPPAYRAQPPTIVEPRGQDSVFEVNQSYDDYGRPTETVQAIAEEKEIKDHDSWDFSDSTVYSASELKSTPVRPDTDPFPSARDGPMSPSRGSSKTGRRKGSVSRRRSADRDLALENSNHVKADGSFKIRFGLRGHLDAVRSVIFTGGGSPGEPEICTAGDEGIIKRWIIPARYERGGAMENSVSADLDVTSFFTHRGHSGSVMCLAAYAPGLGGGRAQGDGYIFSGGQDASVRVWERGRVDPKATLDGHTDAVWAVCVLPTTCGLIFGSNSPYGQSDRILLVSGSADGSVKVWSVSPPPAPMSPNPSSAAGRRGPGGRVRGNSMSTGTSGFPSSPQASVASNAPLNYTLIHTITRAGKGGSPTCITPLSSIGENFVVSYSDAEVLVFDTVTGEQMASMTSLETYDGTINSGVTAVVATSTGLDGSLSHDGARGLSEDDTLVHGATGSSAGIEGTIISGHADRYVRFYDANSGQCTYNMLAHPAAISSLALSPDGQELVSGGHDASLRFWSLEKRSCTQEITSHRLMRGEGVCAVVWSPDGRWVVSAGGDGVVKVFAR